MKIKITSDFKAFELDAGLNSGIFYSREVIDVLKANSGRWFDVDERFLFKDQYVLKPGQNLSNYRITDLMIDKVKNDARVGVNYCYCCGSINPGGIICQKTKECEKLGVFNFNERNTYFLKKHKVIKPTKQIKTNNPVKIGTSFTIETFEDLFILRSKFEGIVIFKITPKYYLIRSGFSWLVSENVPDKKITGFPNIRDLLKDMSII